MENYISFCVNSDDVYNDEGEVIDSVEYWLIEKVYTPFEMRGRGIARQMMNDALAEMKLEESSLPVRLWCEAQDEDTDHELLAAFYESFGFDATGNGSEMEMSF